jgi:hypothetical protein
MEWVGWGGLTPMEQLAFLCGGATTAGLLMGVYGLFGGLALKRTKAKRKRRKAKPKASKGRR